MADADIEAARRYYHEREARRRAQREVERQQWLQRVRGVVSHLVLHYPGVRRVYLFGSLTQPGRFRPGSDIDWPWNAIRWRLKARSGALWNKN